MCEPTDVKLQKEVRTDKMRSQSKLNIPDLPHTKDYHLFICHTECDTSIVREIVQFLESEGLKCCYYERDFPSGRNLVHIINDAIKRSMGIIIILSEESVNSRFCQHEIELAVHTNVTEGYTIIPIKIQPCVIPEIVQTIKYIDAQNKESSEMHILILNAFLQNVWHVEQERTNGLTRSIPLTQYEKGFLKRLSVWRFKLLVSQNDRQSIRMKGFNMRKMISRKSEYGKNIQGQLTALKHNHKIKLQEIKNLFNTLKVSDARFDEMQIIVTSSFHVKYKHIIDGFLLYTALVFLMLGLLLVSSIFAYVAVFFGNEEDLIRSTTTLIGLVCSISFSSILVILMVIVRIKTKNRNQIDCVCVYTSEVKYLDIIRFDPKPCQVVFERRCRNLKSLTKFVTPRERETDTEYTERLFESYLKQNYTRLTVSSNVYGLHEMKNGASCLCTLLENDILKEDQYQLT